MTDTTDDPMPENTTYDNRGREQERLVPGATQLENAYDC
jgi:hypothetical protein